MTPPSKGATLATSRWTLTLHYLPLNLHPLFVTLVYRMCTKTNGNAMRLYQSVRHEVRTHIILLMKSYTTLRISFVIHLCPHQKISSSTQSHPLPSSLYLLRMMPLGSQSPSPPVSSSIQCFASRLMGGGSFSN